MMRALIAFISTLLAAAAAAQDVVATTGARVALLRKQTAPIRNRIQ